jgi:SAM-dependent methyltransferase
MLTVEEYNQQESAAVAALPNRVVEMVNPVVFAAEGYPARVRRDSELWKYLDVMHETRFERDFATLHGGAITGRQFALLQRVARVAHELSRESFGLNLTTRGSLLRALNAYQHIADIFGGSPANVFELGPGSGYLGCLFILNGWGYAASDIAQAFYLFQNRLWNRASGGRVRELAANPDWDGKISPGEPVHLPWWEFYKLFERGVPSFDVVTCNHALAEMNPNSMAFALRVAREMLRGNGLKAFVFEGWGFERFVPRSTITKEFHRCGFNLVHNDDQITVFAPRDSDCASPAARLPRFGSFQGVRSGPPGAAPSRARRPGKFTRSVTAFKELLGSLDFLSGLKRVSASFAFWPPQVSLPMNPASERILSGRQRRATESSVGLAEVNAFYAKLLNSTDFRTADERFLDLIGRSY